MAKKNGKAPEDAAEGAGLVLYQVPSPRGIYLRVGPGRAYHPLGVLENGTEVWGVDLAGMLRTGRKPGEAAWIKVVSKDGSRGPAEGRLSAKSAAERRFTGWVDSEFLERCF